MCIDSECSIRVKVNEQEVREYFESLAWLGS